MLNASIIIYMLYSLKNTCKQICTTLGRWVVEQYDLYSPVSGITTNQPEGFNAVLKQIQQWREIPVDSIFLVCKDFIGMNGNVDYIN